MKQCPLVVTNQLVFNVKRLLEGGTNVKTVAKEMKISTSTVYKIRNGEYDGKNLPDENFIEEVYWADKSPPPRQRLRATLSFED